MHDLCYFPGHFPQRLVVPGVVVIDWVMDFAASYFGIAPGASFQMEAIKFKLPIEPESRVMLDISYDSDKSKLTYLVHSTKGEHSSGRLLFNSKD